MNELDLERRALELQRCQVIKVWYQGHTDICETYHSIAKAIYLQTHTGQIFKIYYADDLGFRWGFGISIKKIIPDHLPVHDIEVVDWPMNNRQIVSVKLHWKLIGESKFVIWHTFSRDDYPQDLEIIFENGHRLFIGVTKILPEGRVILFTNHLTVFFNHHVRSGLYKKAND